MLYCFLDTNILLECKTFDEVLWLDELKVPQVTLVVTRSVLNELDKIKVDPKYKRRRDRAKMLIPRLERPDAILNPSGVAIRANVHLRVIDRPKSQQLADLGLDPNVVDDQIVGAAIIYSQDNPNVDIAVLANDTAVRIKALMSHIKAIAPSEDILLPPEPDEQDKEIKKLHAEIQRLQLAQPQIKFGFMTEHGVSEKIAVNLDFGSAELTEEETERLIQERLTFVREQANKKITEETEANPKLSSALGFTHTGGAGLFLTDREYQKEVEAYRREFAIYAQRLKQYRQHHNRTCLLYIVVSNTGTAPARDIHVELRFQPGFYLSDDNRNDFPVEPQAPSPLALPYIPQRLIFSPTLGSSSQNREVPASKRLSQPLIIRPQSEGFWVKNTYDLLQHNLNWNWYPLYLTFEVPSQSPTVFEVAYFIAVGNKTEKIEGTLSIELTAK